MNITLNVPDELLERAHVLGFDHGMLEVLVRNGLRRQIALHEIDIAHAHKAESGCRCYSTIWHNDCVCGCSTDDTDCRTAGCCGVKGRDD